jgi:hypothetical protein
MTAADKWSLISDSVTAIRISVHPAGKEPNQHVIRVTPGVSRTTTIREVPTKSKSGLCSWDEVWAPSDHLARLSSWAASFSLQQTTLKQEGTVRQSCY